LIFASNTSTIPIAEIAQASRRPENVVGMHFFSPVHKMPLLEIIRHPGTSDTTVATTVEIGRKMGKTIIVVGDGPGFFTSRVLGPFCNEAALCLAQGATVEAVDKALVRWGWPVGALTLLDEVGLDIAAHAGSVMRAHLGERFEAPPAMARLIADKRHGRKAGRGFYRYDQAKKVVDESVYALLGWAPSAISDDEIAERCYLQMLNEIALTMMDGVITNPKDIDIGVIFGFGFPPFRGGILREADRQGLDRIVARFEHYAGRYGARFAPAQLLVDMAKGGERFHAAG
jgi:3-hydroxyacyl-CoA dehydrogenase/enoyl-CoA hydratase/3-hydroxybutyryl-CoA epimerase